MDHARVGNGPDLAAERVGRRDEGEKQHVERHCIPLEWRQRQARVCGKRPEDRGSKLCDGNKPFRLWRLHSSRHSRSLRVTIAIAIAVAIRSIVIANGKGNTRGDMSGRRDRGREGTGRVANLVGHNEVKVLGDRNGRSTERLGKGVEEHPCPGPRVKPGQEEEEVEPPVVGSQRVGCSTCFGREENVVWVIRHETHEGLAGEPGIRLGGPADGVGQRGVIGHLKLSRGGERLFPRLDHHAVFRRTPGSGKGRAEDFVHDPAEREELGVEVRVRELDERVALEASVESDLVKGEARLVGKHMEERARDDGGRVGDSGWVGKDVLVAGADVGGEPSVEDVLVRVGKEACGKLGGPHVEDARKGVSVLWITDERLVHHGERVGGQKDGNSKDRLALAQAVLVDERGDKVGGLGRVDDVVPQNAGQVREVDREKGAGLDRAGLGCDHGVEAVDGVVWRVPLSGNGHSGEGDLEGRAGDDATDVWDGKVVCVAAENGVGVASKSKSNDKIVCFLVLCVVDLDGRERDVPRGEYGFDGLEKGVDHERRGPDLVERVRVTGHHKVRDGRDPPVPAVDERAPPVLFGLWHALHDKHQIGLRRERRQKRDGAGNVDAELAASQPVQPGLLLVQKVHQARGVHHKDAAGRVTRR